MAVSAKSMENASRMPYEQALAIISNIAVSVTIVLYNKQIFQVLKFPGAVTLSAMHSIFGYVLLTLLSKLGFFQVKAIPFVMLIRQSAIWCTSVAFDLLSLKYNSVGFFQVAKLSMLPLATLVNFYLNGDAPSKGVVMCLIWLTLGIGVTTVTDVQVNFAGSLFSLIAVCTTVVNQVWAGQIMKDNNLTSVQYTHALTLYSGAVLAVVGPVVDYIGTGVRMDSYLLDNYDLPLILGIFVTSFLGVGVNISAYWAIKVTSAVTYQVSGQVKNSLIIIIGFVLFAYPVHMKNVFGILVALTGAVAYGFAKIQEQKEKVSDKVLPSNAQFIEDEEAPKIRN
mmetsp:Transcript_25856/g.49128  ORF Transcript_25856/g.49128 Transcript_25856/m.49128 type:complete len:338 (+) Transcript_25856:130-1143(+)|eukprot:CAMPEP_0114242152 /NCGR_PEP_ID=MMETSP0058-20121206/10013_1 /TAXON_ID=36894 /ORGANISM="Pyramimonas parkeae, CCMP726" /LENGTH=337 /DNA_ID=CAMNT_0001354725 /DNA_START=93 /DNA_END=1106 /DNA_ORIENTATION=-